MEWTTALQIPGCCWGAFVFVAPLLGLLVLRCAWCGGWLGIKSAGGADGGVSDGMCGKCHF